MRTLLLSTLLILLLKGFAQTPPAERISAEQSQANTNSFDHLSVRDGLSNNSVTCILQDREGFMWFGTADGLNKYDGYTFTSLKPDPADPSQGFQNNLIFGLCEDHTNRLWVVTERGLYEVNKRTGRVTPHPIRAANADRWNYQHTVYEDSQHLLWISTLGGLARYEPARHRFTLFPAPDPETTIKTVFEDPEHRFWVATYRGLYQFDRSTGKYTLIPVAVSPGTDQPTFIAFHLDKQQVLWLATATAGYGLFRLDLHRQPWRLEPYNPAGQINPFTFLNSLHSDAEGMFWIATTTGLQRVDPIRNEVVTYHPDPAAPKGISSNTVQAVYHDRAGNLWVGTDNGIDRQAVTTKPFMTYQVRPNRGTANLPENKVVALLPDPKGGFWISNGYSVYRPAADHIHTQLIPSATLGSIGQYKNYTQAFLPDGTDGLWIGTWLGLYHFDGITGQYENYPSQVPVEYISRAPNGDIWVGGYIAPNAGIASFNPRTHRYRYYKYNPTDPNGLPDEYIHGLLVSRAGEIWVPFRKRGIGRLNPENGRFIHYMTGAKSGLNSNDIQTVYEDDAAVIWVGTSQGGLNRFNAAAGKFSAITTRDGLLSNNIVGITSDQTGNLWLSTDRGLCRFDPRTKVIHNYQTTNGLPSNDFLRNAVFRQNDRLFFGSLNGVVHFNPDSIRDDTRPFPVYITGLKVKDQIRPLTDSIVTLQHDENFLSFSFAALTYAQSEQNQYAYQLVGVDKEWVKNGANHIANYTKLSPGDYVFQVIAANSDGVWNTIGASIRLIILPPWWATWWAYGIYGLLIMSVIWWYIRFYTNRIQQRQELELNRRQAEQLKTVDELKTRFFANIAHEFRTPLTLIISPVERLLHESSFDNPTRQTLALVHRNAGQLLKLINQLLDLSKLEARRMETSLMRGNVTDFIHHLVTSFQPPAEQKGISLTFSANPLPQEFLFDADKWEKILTNLLANALKFTGEGGSVAVSLTLADATIAGKAPSVRINITDSGIGISPDNLPHIFDRFYQVDTSRTRAYEGTGIGLALVRELIELVGGSISVGSQLNVGTTFRLTLPVRSVQANTDAPQIVLKEATSPEQQLKGLFRGDNSQIPISEFPLLLIVEDNTELREFLANELAASYRILRADDGEMGWQLAQTELPDIVISDVMMPRIDGYELTRLIKNHSETNHIAVVLLTARSAQQSLIEGLQEGADDYLVKPFHLDELYLRLRNLVFHQQRLQAQYRQQLALSGVPLETQTIQDAFLQRVYELLEKHLADPLINVDWLADQLAMSRKTLYRKVHSLLQLSPNELIRQYRLRKAADLLRAGHSAAETAYLTGFRTPSYFATVFKEFYQKTPSEYIAATASKA